jgi:hypothetical protein
MNVNDVNGTSFATWLASMGTSSSAVKGQLYITNNLNASAVQAIFNVTASTNNTTYYTITVTYVSGTISSLNDALVVQFARTGDSGISGYSGTSGISGYSGVPGPGTLINATQDTTTTALYPVMVAATGSNQTPKATTTKFAFNASTGTITLGTGTGGNISGANQISASYFLFGVTDAITAAGSTQGTATVLTTSINNVTTVAASTGVILPVGVAGMRIIVRNGGANNLNVYPNSLDQINSLAVDAPFSLVPNGCIEFVAINAVNWYTLNATYA